MKNQLIALILLLSSTVLCLGDQKRTVDYVNPLLGMALLTNPANIGFKPPWRVWAGLVFPGASVPNAMVQLSPTTKFGSGVGYEYENPHIMSRFYGMGEDGLVLSGMDDAGEMSSWYVFNAIGLYPYSPADPRYIVTVPLFQKTTFKLNEGKTLTILKKHSGERSPVLPMAAERSTVTLSLTANLKPARN